MKAVVLTRGGLAVSWGDEIQTGNPCSNIRLNARSQQRPYYRISHANPGRAERQEVLEV